MPGLQAADCWAAAVWLCRARGLLVARGYRAVRYSRAWKPSVCQSQKLSGCRQGQSWQCAELMTGCRWDLRVARLSHPWAAPAWMSVWGGLRSDGRGTSSLRWWTLGMDNMGPCGSYVVLPAKKEVGTGPKLRQATQIPTQHTVPALTLQHAEHIIQPHLASTAGRIAHASTQQTLLAPRVVHWTRLCGLSTGWL